MQKQQKRQAKKKKEIEKYNLYYYILDFSAQNLRRIESEEEIQKSNQFGRSQTHRFGAWMVNIKKLPCMETNRISQMHIHELAAVDVNKLLHLLLHCRALQRVYTSIRVE